MQRRILSAVPTACLTAMTLAAASTAATARTRCR